MKRAKCKHQTEIPRERGVRCIKNGWGFIIRTPQYCVPDSCESYEEVRLTVVKDNDDK